MDLMTVKFWNETPPKRFEALHVRHPQAQHCRAQRDVSAETVTAKRSQKDKPLRSGINGTNSLPRSSRLMELIYENFAGD